MRHNEERIRPFLVDMTGFCLIGRLSRSAVRAYAALALASAGCTGPVLAQSVPTASASSAATAAGTTVNNQNNSQINTNSFYGFGPGINCPTPTFSVAGFGGSGSGSSNGDVIGAQVDSDNYGGIVSVTFPIGGANAEICKDIGKAQVQALQSQVARANIEARKTQADINLVTAIKCVEIMRVASLTGQFAQLCQGVLPRGMAAQAEAQPPVRQRFNP
jgi:hypothetical protein